MLQRGKINSHLKKGLGHGGYLPKVEKPIGCKLVYAQKRDRVGNVKRLKTRLVAKNWYLGDGVDKSELHDDIYMR